MKACAQPSQEMLTRAPMGNRASIASGAKKRDLRVTSFSTFSSGDFGYSLLVYLVPIDHCGDLGVVLGIVACSYHKFTLIKPNLVNINAYSCHDVLPLAILSVYFELVNISFDVVTLLNRGSFIIFMSNDCMIELIVARVIVFEDR